MTLNALRRRRGSLAWLLLIVALAALLGALAMVPLLRSTGDGRTGTLVGQAAPRLEATDLNGTAWSLGSASARVTWVNFWATSCVPCRTEMPAMQRLAKAHAGELLVLGVDWGEGREAVQDFVDRYGVTYPILLDPTLENYYRWATADGLPRHYFIGADGIVLREVIGPLDPAQMVAILDELLDA
ncbi:MAG: TlpA family protein disulfide reductase [Chloroflexi bacterium]|nr:TlpA family protein disulfide reductase [Chloroflexota bacterium]